MEQGKFSLFRFYIGQGTTHWELNDKADKQTKNLACHITSLIFCRVKQSLLVEAHLILLNMKENFLFLDRFNLKLAKHFLIQQPHIIKVCG